MLRNMIRVMDTRSITFTVTLASALLLAIAGADYFTGLEISLSAFYLLPILLVTLRTNLKYGLLVSFLSAALWILDNYLIVDHVYAHPLIPYWNAFISFVFFLVSAVLSDRVKALFQKTLAEGRLKSAMISVVSHEFNNALTSMSAAVFLLQETEPEGADDSRLRYYLIISSTQQKLKLYVQNFLNKARLEDGTFKLEKKPLALRGLVAEAAASLEELIRQKNITLSKNLPATPVLVSADRDALVLVISNLLGNAVKYTPKDGKITVRLAASGEPPLKIVFTVEDTGHGITPEDIEKITAGFYRTAEGKAAAEGFGLGLKISNEMLALHGSRLQITSKKGEGSSFFFELPALPPESKEPEETKAAPER